MSKISEAREVFQVESARIKKEARARVAAEEAPYREALNAAVVEAYTSGKSISAICREYGTTARVTIIDILREAGVYENPGFRGQL